MVTQLNSAWVESINLLEQAGWGVKRNDPPRQMPRPIHKLFEWVPMDLRRFTECYEELSSPDMKSWLLTEAEFSGRSPSAFAWNEFERQSLEVAGKDKAETARVTAFWKAHFPLLLSVKSGYGYYAMKREDLSIVHGEGPNYEDTTVIAPTFEAFLALIVAGDAAITDWV